MSSDQSPPAGPDLTQGVPASSLAPDSMLAGRVGDDAVLLARAGDDFFAVSASCSHYSGPLVEGIVVGDTVRCPWHHACFSLRTGEAVAAPALNNLSRWQVERRGDKVFVRNKLEGASFEPTLVERKARNAAVVIIGAGAAGNAAAEMLRREGHLGGIVMIGAEDEVPYDRPNLSKDYLAGEAAEEWIPLRSRDFYKEQDIALKLGRRAVAIDATARHVRLDDGTDIRFDRLLLATGADPIRLDVPGADLPHVHSLRSLGDSRAIIKRAEQARRAVVVGASFIGLEVAASLRKRGLEVHVVGLESSPLERVLGRELGDTIRALHESKGVVFHLANTVVAITAETVSLKDGSSVAADLVVMGVGVRPNVALAQTGGLSVDRGVVVNEFLETSAPGIFAAGDIARWPDARFGGAIRVEHWVVAERQGQLAAHNMVAGAATRRPYDVIPFFWSQHYDLSIRYVGHAEKWDKIEVSGKLASHNATVTYRAAGKPLAVATMGRDVVSLRAESAMERGASTELEAILVRR
jgi:NADPH-dependent 2,4-dienoyl-CoA reductase/sulfur reductase-like enzyme/nitrite reductase/ring-hydroxylating ferredoxin subunit